MGEKLTPVRATDILDALIARSDDMIWAAELAFLDDASRLDFWTLEPSGGAIGFRASAYEIKVSAADFACDNPEKQAAALRWSDRFWYVAPPDVIRADLLPVWAGLQIWTGDGFKVIRRAPKRQKHEPTWRFVVSLLRNSGECRRDIGLLKSQVAFYQQQYERARRLDKLREQHSTRKFTALASKASGGGTP